MGQSDAFEWTDEPVVQHGRTLKSEALPAGDADVTEPAPAEPAPTAAFAPQSQRERVTTLVLLGLGAVLQVAWIAGLAALVVWLVVR